MRNSVDIQIDELLASIQSKKVAIFFGAGISFNSNLPLVNEFIPFILKVLGLSQEEISIVLQSEFPFEGFVQTLFEECGNIDELLGIYKLGKPNPNHLILAKLLEDGYVDTICTTNFDTLVEQGLQDKDGINIYSTENQFKNINWEKPEKRLIKIHGTATDIKNMAITLRNVASEKLSISRKKVTDYIFSNGSHDIVLMLGYSCSDVFDISPQILSIRNEQKNIILLEHHSTNQVEHHYIEHIADKVGKNPFIGFSSGYRIYYNTDTLFNKIAHRFGYLDDVEQFESMDTFWQPIITNWYKIFSENTIQGVSNKILGGIFEKISNYKLAYKYYRKFYDMIKSSNRNEYLHQIKLKLGSVCSHAGKNQLALECYQDALQLSQKSNDEETMGMILGKQGEIYLKLEMLDEAIECIDKALQIAFKFNKDELKNTYYGNLGACYGKKSIHQKVYIQKELEYQLLAQELAQNSGDVSGQIFHLRQIGRIQLKSKNFDKAIETFQKALNFSREIGDLQNEEILLSDIGFVYGSNKNLKKELIYHKQALLISRDIRDNNQHIYLLQIGQTLIKLKKYTDACDNLLNALEGYQKAKDESNVSLCLGRLGFIYTKLKQFPRALNFYNRAHRIARKIESWELDSNHLKGISKIFKHLDDLQTSELYLDQAKKLKSFL